MSRMPGKNSQLSLTYGYTDSTEPALLKPSPNSSNEPWSDYQKAIYEFGEECLSNLLIQAVAGSGKSTTLFELATRLKGGVLFLAFNKIIAKHASTKLGSHKNIECRTFHSFGMQLVKMATGFYAKIDTNRLAMYFNSLEEFHPRFFPSPMFYPKPICRKIVRQIRQLGMMSYKVEDVEQFIRETPKVLSIDPRKRSAEEGWVYRHLEQFPKWLKDLDTLPERPSMRAQVPPAKPILTYKNVIDFDDMVRMPCVHNLALRFLYGRDTALIDEAQDMNPYQIHLVAQMYKLGLRLFCCGDRLQCQPDGTQVAMTGGYSKGIEDVQVGDEVVTYQSKNAYFAGIRNQGRKVLEKASRPYEGFLYCFTTGMKRSFSTPNHKWLVRFNENAKHKYLVYLMRKGTQHRIGITTLLAKNHTMGLGLGSRVRVEEADCAWVLSVHGSHLEACVQESLVSLMFGIPETLFSTSKRLRTQEVKTAYLERLWGHVGDNTESARRCLDYFDRHYDYPFYERCDGKGAQHFGKYTSVVYACNVLSGVMSLRTFEADEARGGGGWYPVFVTQEYYKGMVHSLKVQNSETESPGRRLYISDGMVTHNSIYSFRGSYMDSMDRMKKVTEADELPLSVTYRSRQAIVDFVNGTIPESAIIAHKPGGSVEVTAKEHLVQTVVTNDVRMIIGAKNKNLLECWITLAKNRISSSLKGSKIVTEIRDIIDDIQPATLEELCQVLREAVNDATLTDEDGVVTYKISALQVELITAIPELIEACEVDSLQGLENILKEMERDAPRELHTVHSAKGLEAPVVMVLCDWFNSEQLINMKYVAFTRAEDTLILIEDWERGQERNCGEGKEVSAL